LMGAPLWNTEPDVAAYVAASVRLAELQARPARCASGHSTCTWAHLGAGAQCEGGVCRVHARDVAEATGGLHG
jgi:S-methylmethionine-dependent homocysteine/selenocysteine methylase